MPKHIWLHRRAEELMRAISEYMAGDKNDLDLTIAWNDELKSVLELIKQKAPKR